MSDLIFNLVKFTMLVLLVMIVVMIGIALYEITKEDTLLNTILHCLPYIAFVGAGLLMCKA